MGRLANKISDMFNAIRDVTTDIVERFEDPSPSPSPSDLSCSSYDDTRFYIEPVIFPLNNETGEVEFKTRDDSSRGPRVLVGALSRVDENVVMLTSIQSKGPRERLDELGSSGSYQDLICPGREIDLAFFKDESQLYVPFYFGEGSVKFSFRVVNPGRDLLPISMDMVSVDRSKCPRGSGQFNLDRIVKASEGWASFEHSMEKRRETLNVDNS